VRATNTDTEELASNLQIRHDDSSIGEANNHSMELRHTEVSGVILRQINPVGSGFNTHVQCPSPLALPYCSTDPQYLHVT